MKNKIHKIWAGLFTLFIIMVLSTQVKAESFSANKSSVTVGDSFTVTISGINGKVTVSSNDKVSLSSKGTMFVEGSMTITGTAKSLGTGTVTVNLIDVTTTGANPKELTGTRNINVTIKEKEVQKPATTTPTTSTQNKPTTSTTKKTETTKTTTKKTETKTVTPTQEKEEATPQWGIYAVKLTGIKENEEKIDIELDKQFNINTYEYSCNVASDVKKIEIQKEAYDYNEFVTINGLEEDLKTGENIITLKLSKEGQQELTYTIKVNKEEKQEEEPTEAVNAEVVTEETKEEKQPIIVSMPLWCFIILELLIIVATATGTFFVMTKIISKKNN